MAKQPMLFQVCPTFQNCRNHHSQIEIRGGMGHIVLAIRGSKLFDSQNATVTPQRKKFEKHLKRRSWQIVYE